MKDNVFFLKHILESIELIEQFTEGFSRDIIFRIFSCLEELRRRGQALVLLRKIGTVPGVKQRRHPPRISVQSKEWTGPFGVSPTANQC
jgi:hypothetical protein